jgi:hypothetical protein
VKRTAIIEIRNLEKNAARENRGISTPLPGRCRRRVQSCQYQGFRPRSRNITRFKRVSQMCRTAVRLNIATIILNFMGPCIVIIILKYIQQDATLHILFCLETSLHVSPDITTHHQKRKQLYLQHLVLVTPLLLSVIIVEELKFV